MSRGPESHLPSTFCQMLISNISYTHPSIYCQERKIFWTRMLRSLTKRFLTFRPHFREKGNNINFDVCVALTAVAMEVLYHANAYCDMGLHYKVLSERPRALDTTYVKHLRFDVAHESRHPPPPSPRCFQTTWLSVCIVNLLRIMNFE